MELNIVACSKLNYYYYYYYRVTLCVCYTCRCFLVLNLCTNCFLFSFFYIRCHNNKVYQLDNQKKELLKYTKKKRTIYIWYRI